MVSWLLKSEPDSYGWADLVRDGGTEWDGVRNNAAAAHLRNMTAGDRALIYHSGDQKAAVGIARVVRAARRDGDDGNWVSVAIEPVEPLPRPVTLTAMKADPALAEMAMIRQSRLSVSPVTEGEWDTLIRMAAL
jgi:predicted RNA-binding protein with PUA-like domain